MFQLNFIIASTINSINNMYAIAHKHPRGNWMIDYSEQFECQDSADRVKQQLIANFPPNSIEFKVVEL